MIRWNLFVLRSRGSTFGVVFVLVCLSSSVASIVVTLSVSKNFGDVSSS